MIFFTKIPKSDFCINPVNTNTFNDITIIEASEFYAGVSYINNQIHLIVFNFSMQNYEKKWNNRMLNEKYKLFLQCETF